MLTNNFCYAYQILPVKSRFYQIVPKLSEHMMPWKRFVDDTITCIKTTSIPHVIKVLNTFHSNIQFTYEEERDGKIPFLDVLLIRKNDAFETAVYRKPTNKGIYLHWNSFAPETWKRGTLRSIINRAYDICSSDEFLRLELSRIKHDFIKINGYPYWVFNQIHQNVIESREISAKKLNSINDSATETIVSENTKKLYTISLPYKGKKGQNIIKSMSNTLSNVLPDRHVTKIMYTGKKLGSFFSIKDETKKQHQHDLIYYTECPESTCSENYIGEVARRLQERVDEHAGKDSKSHMLQHTHQSGHAAVSIDNFKIVKRGFKNHKMKRKISEALLIKKYRPSLNKQENSVPLMLFN